MTTPLQARLVSLLQTVATSSKLSASQKEQLVDDLLSIFSKTVASNALRMANADGLTYNEIAARSFDLAESANADTILLSKEVRL